MATNIRKRLSAAILAVESKTRSLAAGNDFMIPFLQCAREFDYVRVFIDAMLRRNQTPSDIDLVTLVLFQYGFPRLQSIFHEFDRPPHDGLHFVSNEELRGYAGALLSNLGLAAYARRSLHLAQNDLIRLEDRGGTATFVYHKRHRDYADVASEARSRAKDREAFMAPLRERLTDTESDVLREVNNNVRPFHGRLIAYDSTPLLDDVFMTHAFGHTFGSSLHDVFDEHDEFGGIPYAAYRLAIVMQIMFAYKHDICVSRLARRQPDLHLPDCYTVTASRSAILAGMARGFERYGRETALSKIAGDRKALEQILTVISAERETSAQMIGSNGLLPHLLEFTPKAFIRCRRGALDNPFVCLRRNLSIHFQQDYSRAQRRQEDRQLADLADLLAARFPRLQMTSNIKIRSGGRVLTDLDALLLDLDGAAIYPVQLKYQAPYGLDVGTRRRREEKLLTETASWMDAVAWWKSEVNLKGFLRDCGLKVRSSMESLEVRPIIVSMHHAHFLNDSASSHEFRYATWHDFVEALSEHTAFHRVYDAMEAPGSVDSPSDESDRPFLLPEMRLEDVDIAFVDKTV